MAIIGVSGKARSGKNTFAEMLAEELHRKTGKVYILMAYADELKKMAQREFDLSWDQLWGEEKEKEDKRYLRQPKYVGGVRSDSTEFPSPYWTGREIMQQLGGFYRSIDNNFWVKKLFKSIDEKEYENVIITDVRYPNEVDPIVERNGLHLRIERPLADKIHGLEHASETSLDKPYKVDFSVINQWTLNELRKTAIELVSVIAELNNRRIK